MDPFLWHTSDNLRHLIRAGSVEHAREQIALTHGPDVAERAVIRPLTRPDAPRVPAA